MRVERVAGETRVGQVILDPFYVSQTLHPRCHVQSLLVGQLILRLEHGAPVCRLMPGPRRIELKRAMRHAHVVAMIEQRERVLETAFAEIAPRTDDIGPDVNIHQQSRSLTHASHVRMALILLRASLQWRNAQKTMTRCCGS